eukprot:Skav201079  [mRNA]  locus=scaffold2138:20479:29158:+ [translate_table: standard]
MLHHHLALLLQNKVPRRGQQAAAVLEVQDHAFQVRAPSWQLRLEKKRICTLRWKQMKTWAPGGWTAFGTAAASNAEGRLAA